MRIDKEDKEKETKEVKKSKTEPRKYIAQKTTAIICNGKFELIEGKEIPKGINENFIKSLINSNLIK